jgi:hypothetical protein
MHGRDHAKGGADEVPGIGGIQFDTDPQTGGYLEAHTTTVGPASAGIYLRADVGSILTTGLLLSSDGAIRLTSDHVALGSSGEIDITPTITTLGSGNQALFPRRVDLQLANTTGSAQGSKVVVYDAAGVSVFEVRDDGTVHIKTGGSVVADL